MSMDPSLLPLLMALMTTLLSQATLSKSHSKLIIKREYNKI